MKETNQHHQVLDRDKFRFAINKILCSLGFHKWDLVDYKEAESCGYTKENQYWVETEERCFRPQARMCGAIRHRIRLISDVLPDEPDNEDESI